ncbi:hypothetical protein [Flavobacterium sp. CF136]|uniref:hypothetical protein n=1 Tax=Flavobacterium sp. (strain CF136) TaxID=1144313 RepID=UPI0002719F19|nr:hypothetical protein [Flavobacterium sp. CF136]EJL66311.1 hypothetical protein PMI10_00659 [Flavobacterium sp. CF136]
MIYKSLDTIPYKLFVEISETLNVKLLCSDENQEVDIEELTNIWNDLYDKHLSKNQTSESKKIFKLSKEVDTFITLHKVVLMACYSLRFEFNEDMYNILISKNYKLSIEDTLSYYSDIDKIEREANAYIIKAEYYKGMLPDPEENTNTDYTVDDIMASHSAILGYDIGADYNLVTYNKYYATEKQVNAKIKSIQNQIQKNNGK